MFQLMWRIVVPTILFAMAASSASAATVAYSGKLFAEFGPPVVGGEVIIGTFAPGFDPFQYNCVYGDEACNQIGKGDLGAFEAAVMDGNFFPIANIPIGLGAVTDFDGSFAGSGITSAPAGTQIWMFAFEDLTRNSFYQVLASSPSWLVPSAGTVQLVASQATMFVMGFSHPEGIQLNVIPFPEPTGMVMAGVAALVVGAIRVRR